MRRSPSPRTDSTGRGVAAAPESPVPSVTSVITSGPASPASTVVDVAASSTVPPFVQGVTSIGRRCVRSRTRPSARVSRNVPPTDSTGPLPQGSSKAVPGFGCGVRYSSSAGMWISLSPTGSCNRSSATGLWTVSGACREMVMSSRSVLIGEKRAIPFSSTAATAVPSGELICTCSGRVESPPAAAKTISPTSFFSGHDRCRTGRSPAIHAVVRSPSVRLRALRPVPSRAVESALTSIRSRSPVSSNSSLSKASPGTGTALAESRYAPGSRGVNCRCRPTSAATDDSPPGSLPRRSE